MDNLDELQAIERQLERDWWWLNGALHAVAKINSGDPAAYLEMADQKREVDRKRIEISTRIAALVGPPRAN